MNLNDHPCELYDFPASFGQEQLWYLHEIAPESTAYNIAFAFDIHGELVTSALEQAFALLIQRHDALRTAFAVVDEQLRQIVCASVPFRLKTIDLAGHSPTDREAELVALKRGCARHRFDLAQAPLLQVHLVAIGPDRHVLLFCIHHIVVDHQSVLQLGHELEMLYRTCRDEIGAGGAPGESAEDEERLQFPDYVVWQREQMSDEVISQKLEYWNSVLGAKPHTLDLPTDRPRPALQSFAGAELPVRFPRDLSSALRSHAQREKQSLFVLMLAALNVVLHKYSGRRDLIVGCPMANRPADELHDVVGLFMNVLPVPVAIDPAQGFDQLAHHVRRQVAKTQSLQDTPFERIVRAGEVGPRSSHNPLVQVWFTFQDAPLTLRLHGLEVVSEALHNGGSKLDLSLWYWDDGGCIQGLIEYSTDLFDEDTVRALSRHLMQVLRQVAATPHTPVADLGLLSAEDLRMLQANRTGVRRDDVLVNMHEAFFERAAGQPGRKVLDTAAGSLSAGELALRADAMGLQLQRLGVSAGDIVGVCMERDENLLAALLGVLRCGAAYLPLDPSLPEERIAYMLEDSGVRVAIAGPATRDRLPLVGVEVLMGQAVPAIAGGFVPHAPSPGDLAYLIYTSGSTGRPKGVRIAHGAAGNFLSTMRERPGIGEHDVVLAVTTYAFDISVLELFLPLAFGAGVWLADRGTTGDGRALQALLRSGGITMLQATPSTWRLLRASGWEGQPGLKALVGGEALSPELAQWLLPRVGELWNMYGPTETTVWSSCARIGAENAGHCPIGQPIANTSIQIVDENLRLLPDAVPGELVIGGRGLSLGYNNREELTRERFVRLPETGEDVYRTGDRALWRNGELQHLGRYDDQVKVRGFRIELGEIESVLATLPELEFVAARIWRIDDDDHRVVAYYCSRSGAPVPETMLREHAKTYLPAYMLPQHFVPLSTIPLLPNGKVDRNALPLPTFQQPAVAVALADSPLSPHERLVLAACRDLIGSDAVMIDDNFFDVGGHSLLALTLVGRVEEQTGTRLPILKVASSSLRGLAEHLGDATAPLADVPPRLGPRLNRWVRRAFGPDRGSVHR